MQFDSWSAFWAMGGYGFYVWLSFASVLLCLLALRLETSLKRKHWYKVTLAEQERRQRIKRAKEAAKQENQL